ncbi:hypothetical protein [Pseudobacter ginsenosidimutans]|uniref:hypothetical protein n=1 Tax=Pseudobacter ginsenosidimutans TaxID=661488 RepID=UPI00102D6C29|nr:hypothetical protein [Pseudobacter ginsenosidimutans]QEC44757.1 hypothetical protein FSB84_24870 [Pseudobacter ginsenosidimutans]
MATKIRNVGIWLRILRLFFFLFPFTGQLPDFPLSLDLICDLARTPVDMKRSLPLLILITCACKHLHALLDSREDALQYAILPPVSEMLSIKDFSTMLQESMQITARHRKFCHCIWALRRKTKESLYYNN